MIRIVSHGVCPKGEKGEVDQVRPYAQTGKVRRGIALGDLNCLLLPDPSTMLLPCARKHMVVFGFKLV